MTSSGAVHPSANCCASVVPLHPDGHCGDGHHFRVECSTRSGAPCG